MALFQGGPLIQGSNTGGGFGGTGQLGSIFKQFSQAPNANIAPAKVDLPNPGDYGTPGTAPTINDPSKGNYGLDPAQQAAALKGIEQTGAAASEAQFGFNNPTKTGAFATLMNQANEQLGAGEQAAAQSAKDAAQRRGYAGGFEDSARQTSIDKMNALASAGFTGADSIRKTEGDMYGKAIGAFTALQDSYNQAEAAGNTAFAHDLTSTHIENAANQLKTMDLNQQQRAHYGDALNQARQLQAQLNEKFNQDKIDNSRFIQGNAQIAAQLAATMATLGEKGREFDITAGQQQQQFGEGQREFNVTHQDAVDRSQRPRGGPGDQFLGLA